MNSSDLSLWVRSLVSLTHINIFWQPWQWMQLLSFIMSVLLQTKFATFRGGFEYIRVFGKIKAYAFTLQICTILRASWQWNHISLLLSVILVYFVKFNCVITGMFKQSSVIHHCVDYSVDCKINVLNCKLFTQCKGSNWANHIYSKSTSYLEWLFIPKISIDSNCKNVNSFILSCHT